MPDPPVSAPGAARQVVEREHPPEAVARTIAYAAQHLTPAERDAYNARLADPAQAGAAFSELSVREIKARNASQQQGRPTREQRQAHAVSASHDAGGYTNASELLDAITAKARRRATPEQLARIRGTDPGILDQLDIPG